MGREVRRVPKDWKHPADRSGLYQPLMQGYEEHLKEWQEGLVKWLEGLREDYKNRGWKEHGEDCTEEAWAEWHGKKPLPTEYMPSWTKEEATHYMMYENVSEGTPISPAFATPEELARWLADSGANAGAFRKASYEQWLETIKRGSAPSMMAFVGNNGATMVSGVEATTMPLFQGRDDG